MPYPPTPRRVMIVDDQYSVRESLAFGLNLFNDLLVVGQASDGQEAVSLCAKVRPDVILMDLTMPHLDGVEATRLIHSRFPGIYIIALSNLDSNEPQVKAAMHDGACAFLNKQTSIHEVASVIQKIDQGVCS